MLRFALSYARVKLSNIVMALLEKYFWQGFSVTYVVSSSHEDIIVNQVTEHVYAKYLNIKKTYEDIIKNLLKCTFTLL